jgi:hypothetical protein
MSIDAISFIPQKFLSNRSLRSDNFPKIIAAFTRPTAPNQKNTITLDPNSQEPIVTISHDPPFSNSNSDVKGLWDPTREAIEAVRGAVSSDDDNDTYWNIPESHGNIPMPGAKGKDGK